MDYVRIHVVADARRRADSDVGADRYIHGPGQGWYALTREGLGGPFEDKREAEIFVARVIAGEILPEPQDKEILPEPQDKKHVSR